MLERWKLKLLSNDGPCDLDEQTKYMEIELYLNNTEIYIPYQGLTNQILGCYSGSTA